MPSRLRLAVAFFAVFIEINLMMITIVYTVNYYKMSPASFIVNVLGWSLALIAVGFLVKSAPKSNAVFIFPFLCVMASLVVAVSFNNTFTILTGKEVKNVSVADAESYRDAAVIGFRDGRLESGYMGVHVDRNMSRKSSSASTYYAVPYVPDSWDKSRPVTVWVLCKYSTDACLANTRTAVVKDVFPGGVKEAEEKYGLKSDPKALTVHWIADAGSEIARGRLVIMAGMAAVNAAWLLVFLASVFWHYRGGRQGA